MRNKLVLPVLLVVLLAACSGGGPASSGNPPASQAQAGSVDCEAMNTAGQQLLAVQFLAQLKDPDTIESIRTKHIGNLDLDVFLAAMHDLHALDSHASPLGDPKAAIEVYETAAKAAKVLFATQPMTQEAIDTYNQNVGPVSDFLGHQVAIAGALDEAGC